MVEFLGTHYLWIKAFHVISVMAWMAGLLYLPRLFVYHASVEKDSDQSETFKIMERRLLRVIMNPAMVAAWVFGLSLLWANPDLLQEGWVHIKLSCVAVLTVMHHLYVRWWKMFLKDENRYSAKFFRLWNEVPAVLMIIIVIMAVVEPF